MCGRCRTTAATAPSAPTWPRRCSRRSPSSTTARAKAARPIPLEVVQATAEVGDVWQSHRTMTDDAAHQTEDALIANLTEENDCAGHWITATVQPDGRTWTITNGRTGYSRNYQSK